MVYLPVNEDHRVERSCPHCGGTGKLSDALYAKLAGDDLERVQVLRDEARNRVWYSGSKLFFP